MLNRRLNKNGGIWQNQYETNNLKIRQFKDYLLFITICNKGKNNKVSMR